MRRERFPSFKELPGIYHGFLGRQAVVDVNGPKETVMPRMWPAWNAVLADELPVFSVTTAEQIHGDGIHRVFNHEAFRQEVPGLRQEVPGVDALVTDCPRTVLGIVVADCCAVYLVDPKRKVIGLCHSGKKGTELEIVPKTINIMVGDMGCKPHDIIAQLSPCIRPPHYEVDIADLIQHQLSAVGVGEIHVSRSCTASDCEDYYSYRREKGRTGRMLAYLAME